MNKFEVGIRATFVDKGYSDKDGHSPGKGKGGRGGARSMTKSCCVRQPMRISQCLGDDTQAVAGKTEHSTTDFTQLTDEGIADL